MSIEGQCHFFTIYFPAFVCFVLYKATISGDRLHDHWFSGLSFKLDVFLINFSVKSAKATLKLSERGSATGLCTQNMLKKMLIV